MKDWVRAYDKCSELYGEYEASEFSKLVTAQHRFAETGHDEQLQLRGRGGSLTVIMASTIRSIHYITEDSFRGMIEIDAKTEVVRREVRRHFPDLEE